MKAAWFERFGAAEDVLITGELPTPAPASGEVLVRLHASSPNPSDVKKRAGAAPGLLDAGFVVPHSDGAGVITAVGEGVDAARLGERVWVYQAQHGRRFGTAAEYVAIDANRAATLPAQAEFAVGACLGIPAMTAHRTVFADGPVSGQRVLVTGGAGRVGWYAIQWAVAAGATVITTASNAVDREACLGIGAHAVVNHREADWGKQVLEATGGARIDRVIDVEFGANLPQVLECVRSSGTLVSYGSVQVPEPVLPFRRMMFLDLLIRLVIVYDMPESAKQDAIRDINAALAANSLRHRIAGRFALADIAASHRLVESGTARGCVIVETP
jgi:NADPH:quinone reductase-like Zn-dependent oxidoreductase